MALDDMLDDRKAEAGTARAPASRLVDAIESLGQARQVNRTYPRASVVDPKKWPAVLDSGRNDDRRVAVANCIGEQIIR